MKIDIECSICGKQMFTIDSENIVGPVSTICEECRIKRRDNLERIIYS